MCAFDIEKRSAFLILFAFMHRYKIIKFNGKVFHYIEYHKICINGGVCEEIVVGNLKELGLDSNFFEPV